MKDVVIWVLGTAIILGCIISEPKLSLLLFIKIAGSLLLFLAVFLVLIHIL